MSLETENKLSTTNASDRTMMERDESWEKIIKQITDKNKCTSTSALLDFDERITSYKAILYYIVLICIN